MLFTYATILTETPPLRACWSLVGEQAGVPITGNRDKRVVFGALDPATGAVWLDGAGKWKQEAFQDHLRNVRACRRGWRIVRFLGRGGLHTTRASRTLAAEPGVEPRLLPTACPKLNPVEGLWRPVKGRVLANEPTPDLTKSLDRVTGELHLMVPNRVRTMAGVNSGQFWVPTYKDCADGLKAMTLDGLELILRWDPHVLPWGFVKARHYELLAIRGRGASLAVCWQRLVATGVRLAAPVVVPAARPAGSPRCGSERWAVVGWFGPYEGPVGCATWVVHYNW